MGRFQVMPIEELELALHCFTHTAVEILRTDLLLHFGAAKIGTAQGRQMSQGLALLLQTHNTVFLKHDEALEQQLQPQVHLG